MLSKYATNNVIKDLVDFKKLQKWATLNIKDQIQG